MARLRISLFDKFLEWFLQPARDSESKAIMLELIDGKEIFMSDLVLKLNTKYPKMNLNQNFVTGRVRDLEIYKMVEMYERDFKRFVRITEFGKKMLKAFADNIEKPLRELKKEIGGKSEEKNY